MIKKLIQIAVFIGIAWYLLQDIEFFKLLAAIEMYSIAGLTITMFLIGFSYVVLAIRWHIMTNKACSIGASFEASVITGFLNMILPAKVGELSKVLYLKKYYKFQVNNSLSLLFIERFLDLIVLTLFLIVVNIYFIENEQIKFFLIALLLFISVFLFLLKTNILFKMMKYIPFRVIRIFGQKIVKTINKQFKNKNIWKIIFITSCLWLMYFLTYWIFFGFTVNFDLTFYQVSIFFIISTIALAVPLTPGGVGTFQASIVFVGNMFGIIKEDSLAAGIILYLLMLMVDFILFYYVLSKKDIKINDLLKK